MYKSYVVLNSHIQKRHSGAYIATPNSSYAALDTSATPGSPSPSSPSKSFLSNVEAEELFDQDEIDEKDLPWSHYRFKETSGAYSPRKYAKQKEINTNQGFVKKKRGRPRKYPLHSGHIQENLETVPADNTEGNFINEDNIKMDVEVGYEHTQDDNETPVKRKRGRPRKYPKQADQIVADLSDQTLDPTAVNENDTGSFIDDNSSIMDTDKQKTIIDNDSIKINEFRKLNRNINANDTIENYKTSNKPFAYLTGDNITVPGIKRLPPQDNSIVKVSSQENKSEDNAKSANLENDDAASNNESHNNSKKSVTNKVINESKSTNTPAKKFILAKLQSQDNEPTKNKNKESQKDKGKSERNESVLDILAKWEQSNKMEDLSEVNKNHDNHDKNIKTITHQVDIKEEPSDTPEIDELAQIKQFIENDTFAKTKVDAAKDNDINDVTDDKEMEEKVDTECIQHDDQMEIEITR